MRLCFIFFLCTIIAHAQDQKSVFRGGLQGGFTSAQIHGDGVSGFDKAGWMSGFIVQMGLGKKSTLQMEINYVTKGSFDPPKFDLGKYNWMKIHLEYVEVPFQWNYHHKKWIFSLGASAGFLTKNVQQAQGILPPVIYPIYKYEVATIFGLGYQLSPQWNVIWRNSLSLLPIAGHTVFNTKFLGLFGGAYNQYMGFQVVYYFKSGTPKP